nr:hypothetical protein [uncultured Cohaesibacter sp.]
MARVSGSIPNLVNGVSQQAAAVRLATQGELQVNAYSTIVDGLKKRPPTNHVALLFEDGGFATQSSVTSHLINRDQTERYQVSIFQTEAGDGILKVVGFDGVERTVSFPDGADYLSYPTGLSQSPFKLVTVADYTFVVNKTKTVSMTSETTEIRPAEALVHIMAGNYGRTYSISIDGTEVASFETPDGSSASQVTQVDTTYIAQQLYDGLVASDYTEENGWTVKLIKNAIYIKKASGNFGIDVVDGYNNNAAVAVKGEIQDFSDLPSFAEDGFIVRTTASEGTEFDDYWVRFEATDSGTNRGVWRECPAPGVAYEIDPSTMPHALVREEDGSFTFQEVDWPDRTAGDEDIIPRPSFVGRTISDLFFYKNRLGFLSDEFIIMSKSGEFFDFWPTSATAQLDDDPIDVSASHTKVSLLKTAVPFQDRLILFSPQTQFVLKGSELLTPKSISIRPTTEFESSLLAEPVAAGKNIYFTVDRGSFTMLREYSYDDNTELADAADVTSHVPQYVPDGVFKIASSSHEDVLICASDKEPSAMYVYKYYWSGQNKLQSSWSKWEFPNVDRVLDFGFIESALYVIFLRGSRIYLERMDVQPGIKDDDIDYVIHLDQRSLIEAGSYVDFDFGQNQTTFNLPSYLTETDVNGMMIVTAKPGEDHLDGMSVDLLSIVDGKMVLLGDYRNTPLYIGKTFETRYKLSPMYIRQESAGGGVSAITEGRLQILYLILQYTETGYFRTEVTPQARQTHHYVFNGRNMGDPMNIAGTTVLSSGSFRFPVLSKNDRVEIEIVNDSYLPMAVLSAEWTGTYVRKSQRI